MGGRGASGDLHDGPSGGGKNPEKKYGQPGTPQVPPTASIRGQVGEKGKPVQAGVAIKKVNPISIANMLIIVKTVRGVLLLMS